MTPIEAVHSRYVAGRRVRVIASRLAEVIPPHAKVLDIGCGDGEIAWLLCRERPDLRVTGVDVLVRERIRVPVTQFDGRRLPFQDGSFDVVTFVDVLHHCQWPAELLAEASRVASDAVVIKDHLLQGVGAQHTLRFMDAVGNRRHGVALPYNYQRPDQWAQMFDSLGLIENLRVERLGLYQWPLNLVFERNLHLLTRLSVPAKRHVAAAPDLLESAGIS